MSSAAEGQVRHMWRTDGASSSVEVICDFELNEWDGEDKRPILASSSENGRLGSRACAVRGFCFLLSRCRRGESRELDVTWDWDLQGHAVEQGGRGGELPADGLGALSQAGSGSEAERDGGQQECGGSGDLRNSVTDLLEWEHQRAGCLNSVP